MVSETTKNAEIQELLDKLELRIESEFVPFSKSRNAAEKMPSLNWRVTLFRGSKAILTTDYSAGYGHCPCMKNGLVKHEFCRGYTLYEWEVINRECEDGKAASAYSDGLFPSTGKKILPDTLDVVYSLVSDADVMNHDGFESWASELGYDTDSRKADTIYRTCLDFALKIRNGFGDDNFKLLQEAFYNY